jgi:hypothetical protein
MIPPGLLPGPQVVQLTSPNGVNVPPVLVYITSPSPTVVSAVNGGGVALNATSVVNPGDTVTLVVDNLADANGNYPAPANVSVTVAGVAQTVTLVTPANGPGAATIQFVLTSGVPTGPQQLVVMQAGMYLINVGS